MFNLNFIIQEAYPKCNTVPTSTKANKLHGFTKSFPYFTHFSLRHSSRSLELASTQPLIDFKVSMIYYSVIIFSVSNLNLLLLKKARE